MSKRQRIVEIARVFGALAADEARRRLGTLSSETAGAEEEAPDPRGSAIRRALEQLGPFYIKVGQLLSTRPDLVSEPVIKELQLLHDHVSPGPFSDFEPVLRANLGDGWSSYFRDIDTSEPLGTASLAQVYKATRQNGEKVVVKVQRPGIKALVLTDMEILERALKLTMKRAPGFAEKFDPEAMLESVFAAMRPEIDFTVEASNMEEYAEITEHYDHLAVPRVVHVTKEVLIMARAPGTSIRSCDPQAFTSEERLAIGRDLLGSTCRSLLVEGFFHADPHPGNVFVAPGEPAHLIDFGMMGRFDLRLRNALTRLFMSMGVNDGVATALVLAEMGRPTTRADLPGFIRDVQRFVPTITTASFSQLNFGVALTKLLVYFSGRGIVPPPSLALMGKAMGNVEGSVRYIAPELSIMDTFNESVSPIVFAQARQLFSQEELFRTATEVVATARLLPEQIRTVAQDLATGGLSVKVTADSSFRSRHESSADARVRALRRTAVAIALAYYWTQRRRRAP